MSEPRDVIAAFYETYNAHDAQAVGRLYAEDGLHEDIAGARRRQGRDAVVEGVKGFFAMLPDVAFEIEHTVLSRASAVVFYRMRGHIGRDFGAMPTKGKQIDLAGVHVFVFAADRIQSTTDYWDEADFKSQLSA